MSLIETPWLSRRRYPSKRKFDEDDVNDVSDSLCVRTKKAKAIMVNSCSHHGVGSSSSSSSNTSNEVLHSSSRSSRSRTPFQFFVHLLEGGSTAMFAYPEDTVKSIHERIKTMKKIPLFNQRLIYEGKQLQWNQTLAECGIDKEANVHLVGRLHSTENPAAWRSIDDLVTIVYRLCRGETIDNSLKSIKNCLDSFVKLTPENDATPDKVSDFFYILNEISFPNVLVMLYLSSYPGNKLTGDACIRHFMTSCRDTSQKFEYALVVVEFCKLLRTRMGSQNSLYQLCRSTLALLDSNSAPETETETETENVDNISASQTKIAERKKSIQDVVYPFIREVCTSLVTNLDLSMESPSLVGPLMDDVVDFTSFSNRLGVDDLHLVLNKMDQCLQKMEQRMTSQEMGQGDKNLIPACSHYLAIFKQSYKALKLHRFPEEKLWGILMRQKSVLCLLIVRYAKREDGHQWLLERRSVTNFESRRHLAMLMFPELKEDYEQLHEMLIDRSHLLTESFEYIVRADTTSLHAGLFMEFKNEEATGPGVLREWFFLVCQAIFNPQNALFVACPNDRRRFFPNPASKVHPLHLEYFSFSGRVIALALMHRVQVGIVFDRVFFFQLAGKDIILEDIRDADPVLYSSCKQILEMDSDFIDSDALGLTFVREVEELGQRKEVELCPGGKNIVVNSNNRVEYINLLIKDRFVTSISQQVSHFARGFADILSSSKLRKLFFQGLEPEDLDWMLCGSDDTISVEDWKAHTEYNGYEETDIQVSWFWEILGRMTAEERKVLLFFWTSVKYLPVEGFCGLASRLYISKSHEPGDRLPSSHTCFYRLCFPAYSSMAVMEDRLKAIAQEHIGCSFGTW